MSKRAARLKQEAEEDKDDEPEQKKSKVDDALIQSLIERVGASSSKVDPVWLTHLLDASSGNLDLAASYFWDNYVLQAQEQDKNKPREEKTIKKLVKEESKDDDIAVRQRLESRFESVLRNQKYNGDQDKEKEQDDDNDNDADDEAIINNHHPGDHRRQPENDSLNYSDDNDDDAILMRNANDDDEDDDDEIRGDIANDHNPNDRNIQHEISASVSDDDDGIWRITRMERSFVRPPGASLRPNLPREQATKKNCDGKEEDQNDANQNDNNLSEDSDLCLSDDDWLIKPSSYTEHTDNKTPLEILWGSPASVTKPSSSSDSRNDDSNNNHAQDEENEEGSNNVSMDDDDDNDGNSDRDQQDEDGSSRIPSTWLNAGFFMCPEEGNLLLKLPSEEDVALHRWRQSQDSQNSHQSQLALPPHYCKSVTALLSIVQATMLSGTSIQGGTLLDCSSNQTPWGDFSAQERKKHFDKRLVQALSALLFLAWKAAKTRKEKALQYTKNRKRQQFSNIPNNDDHLWGMSPKCCVFQKRLEQLCPTCGWEVDSTTGESRLPETPSNHEVIMTSFTNIHDISSYVRSNIRVFTAKGGCVLFLETLIRIHGAKAISRQMSRNDHSGKENNKQPLSCLIHCTCEARQIKPPPTKASYSNSGNSNKNVVLDTTPPGHDCFSLELLSLILTGEVHSSWNQDWSIYPSLEFGLLSSNSKEHALTSSSSSNRGLLKPKIWLLRGETCHSVAWTTSNTYNNSDVMKLSHWNNWFGLSHNLTHFRLVRGRERWKPPVLSKYISKSIPKKKLTVVDRIWQQRQREKEAERVLKSENNTMLTSTDADGNTAKDDSKHDVDKNSKPKFLMHPEDKSFYPDNYRHWRYQFPTTSAKDSDWISFSKLDSSQREMVELQMAPSIHFVFRNSGYKNAILDQFQPAPPVV
eukprot:CAMPEP_0194251896 /NCGR_PEP_ID=MMETSP0158-20130606/26418_1 /TAXON_ID=33649 /ORGANISM="Thalassionema nitzschioides, Strain L26-B" /LENGTH=922 /DNA_ID=CAMNT_0038989165 /DNA_START=338 /DNA_END=3106 /DNA_ORIENTATION=-